MAVDYSIKSVVRVNVSHLKKLMCFSHFRGHILLVWGFCKAD